MKFVLAWGLVVCVAAFNATAGTSGIRIDIGQSASGVPSGSWLSALEGRLSKASLDDIGRSASPFSREESRYVEAIRQAVKLWENKKKTSIEQDFSAVQPPVELVILIGNQGGDDGFSAGMSTIALDVSSWVESYPAEVPDVGRIQRVLSHEYVHLLTKAWLKYNPVAKGSPFERALFEIYYEGLGNYYSLSEKWKGGTPLAEKTLRKLEGTFVSRLGALVQASPGQEKNLRSGLSAGPFQEKWGALTAALWLDREVTRGIPIQAWLSAGSKGVLELARRNLSQSHLPSFYRGVPKGLIRAAGQIHSLKKAVDLPFSKGTRFRLHQGPWVGSHGELGNEYSWDLSVPYGTNVLAVAAGRVLSVWQPAKGGGCDKKFSSDAHNIKVVHLDGTVAQYVHLQSFVEAGQVVSAGQKIGVTSRNGWICAPHLHFGIYRSRHHMYSSAERRTLPLYFKNEPTSGFSKGRTYLVQ